MIHLSLQKSENDYAAHLLVWRFLDERMSKALGSGWAATCIGIRSPAVNYGPALNVSMSWLTDGAV